MSTIFKRLEFILGIVLLMLISCNASKETTSNQLMENTGQTQQNTSKLNGAATPAPMQNSKQNSISTKLKNANLD